ncbi:MAG: hypothetical protein K2Y35_00750 [Burkholderiales bacterium]|nr:hypothetical protein [Burkholderiales bacterium]
MNKQFPALSTVALAAAFATLTLSAPAHAGRMFDLVKPAAADAASISRGNSSPRAHVSTWHAEAVAQSRTGIVKSGQFAQREARCDVRDVCSSGAVGAIATQPQPSVQAQGEALTTIR